MKLPEENGKKLTHPDVAPLLSDCWDQGDVWTHTWKRQKKTTQVYFVEKHFLHKNSYCSSGATLITFSLQHSPISLCQLLHLFAPPGLSHLIPKYKSMDGIKVAPDKRSKNFGGNLASCRCTCMYLAKTTLVFSRNEDQRQMHRQKRRFSAPNQGVPTTNGLVVVLLLPSIPYRPLFSIHTFFRNPQSNSRSASQTQWNETIRISGSN